MPAWRAGDPVSGGLERRVRVGHRDGEAGHFEHRQVGCIVADAGRLRRGQPEVAQRHSGYQVGGTSPFATRKTMPIFLERTILDLPKIYINGGRRGFLLGIATSDLASVLNPTPVDVAIDADR